MRYQKNGMLFGILNLELPKSVMVMVKFQTYFWENVRVWNLFSRQNVVGPQIIVVRFAEIFSLKSSEFPKYLLFCINNYD